MDPAGLRLRALAALIGSLACAATSALGEERSLSACRSIANDEARLACYDAITGGTEPTAGATPAAAAATPVTESTTAVPAPSQVAAPSPRAQQGAATAAPSPEDLFGHSARQSEEITLRAAGVAPIDHMDARVASVRLDANGKLVLALENGQVWSQVDSAKLRIKAGEDVRIRRAVLDSYLLTRAGGGAAIRVRRGK